MIHEQRLKWLLNASYVTSQCHGWKSKSTNLIRSRFEDFTGGDISYSGIDQDDIEVFCFFNHEAKEINVVFQGSKSWNDWMRNLDFRFITAEVPHNSFIIGLSRKFRFQKNDAMRMHRGFQKAFHHSLIYISKRIFKAADISDASDYKVIVSGHSQGAAFALLSSFFLELLFETQIEVFTFGCPAIADKDFDSLLKQRNISVLRVVNHMDIVTWINRFLPGQNAVMNGDLLYFDEQQRPCFSTLRTDPNVTFRKVLRSIFAVDESNLFISHSPAIYYQNVSQYYLRSKKAE